MARGQQKIQSQQKAAEKQAKMKKQAGHSATAQKAAAAVALKASCSVCKVSLMIKSKSNRDIKYQATVNEKIWYFLGTNAGSKDVQATFWEQALKAAFAWRPERCLKFLCKKNFLNWLRNKTSNHLYEK